MVITGLTIVYPNVGLNDVTVGAAPEVYVYPNGNAEEFTLGVLTTTFTWLAGCVGGTQVVVQVRGVAQTGAVLVHCRFPNVNVEFG